MICLKTDGVITIFDLILCLQMLITDGQECKVRNGARSLFLEVMSLIFLDHFVMQLVLQMRCSVILFACGNNYFGAK